jgi:hypothetical protein
MSVTAPEKQLVQPVPGSPQSTPPSLAEANGAGRSTEPRLYCGLTAQEATSLVMMTLTTTEDAISDLLVMREFWVQGDTGLFMGSLGIHILNATVFGALAFGAMILPLERTMPLWQSCTIGFVLGLLSLVPVVQAVLVMKDASRGRQVHGKGDDMGSLDVVEHMAFFEIILETLPQASLQAFVGVAYGRFNPASGDFSSMLLVSLVMSFVQAGTAAFGFEMSPEQRGMHFAKQDTVHLFSMYGIFAVLHQGCKTGAVVLINALLICAFGAWSIPGVIVTCVLVSISFMEPGIRNGDRVLEAGAPAVYAFFGAGKSAKHGMVLSLLILPGALCLGILAFSALDHAGNDYGEQQESSTADGLGVYHDCEDRTEAVVAFYALLISSIAMGILSFWFEPFWGFNIDDERRAAITDAADREAEEHKAEQGPYRPPGADERWGADTLDLTTRDEKMEQQEKTKFTNPMLDDSTESS